MQEDGQILRIDMQPSWLKPGHYFQRLTRGEDGGSDSWFRADWKTAWCVLDGVEISTRIVAIRMRLRKSRFRAKAG